MGFTFTQVSFSASEVRHFAFYTCGGLGWVLRSSLGLSWAHVTPLIRGHTQGGGRGGRRNRQAGDGGMDQDVKYPGTQQVSQVGGWLRYPFVHCSFLGVGFRGLGVCAHTCTRIINPDPLTHFSPPRHPTYIKRQQPSIHLSPPRHPPTH